MSIGHINFGTQTANGTDLRSQLATLERTVQRLSDHLAIMDSMKDDGSITSYLQGKYGYATLADATSGYNELNSLLGKLASDGNVSFVNAAILQAARKFG